MNKISRLTKSLQDNMLRNAFISIILGVLLGYIFPASKNNILNGIITVLVFGMIYPMMINLDVSKFTKILKRPKPILLSVLYNYLITLIISIIIVKLFINDQELALGFLLVMLIPGSSMSIAYTGLAKGSLEVATISLATNFILVPVTLPFILGIFSKSYDIDIPTMLLMKTVFYVLILPMILGHFTRRSIINKKGEDGFNRLKPLFGFITLICMLFVIFSIFYLKALLIINEWHIIVQLLLVTCVYMFLMLIIVTYLDKKLGLTYEEHAGIVFLSTGKNNGTAIAIAMMAFGAKVAIPAATLPLFQIIFLIIYLKMTDRLKSMFAS